MFKMTAEDKVLGGLLIAGIVYALYDKDRTNALKGLGQYMLSPQQCSAFGCTQYCGNSTYSMAPATGTLPNVIGQSEWAAAQALEAAGYNLWITSTNGVAQSMPTDWNPKRVLMTVNNGIVTSTQVG